MEKNWLKHYPAGVPAEIDADVYPSLVELMEAAFKQFPERPACAGTSQARNRATSKPFKTRSGVISPLCAVYRIP